MLSRSTSSSVYNSQVEEPMIFETIQVNDDEEEEDDAIAKSVLEAMDTESTVIDSVVRMNTHSNPC